MKPTDTHIERTPARPQDLTQALRQFSAWQEASRETLKTALERVRGYLENPATPQEAPPVAPSPVGETTLETLCKTFALAPFERDLLLLCAGVELDGRFQALCAERQGNAAQNYPTFNLALNILPGAYWSALTPAAPLRRYRFIEVVGAGSGPPLTVCPLRLDEWILHYLLSARHADPRLPGTLLPHGPLDQLLYPSTTSPRRLPTVERLRAAGQEQIADKIFALLQREDTAPVIQLCGDANQDKIAVAHAVARRMGYLLRIVSLSELPRHRLDQETFLALWERENLLIPTLLLIEADTLGAGAVESNDDAGSSSGTPSERRTELLLERLSGKLLLACEKRVDLRRHSHTVTIDLPGMDEQIEVWASALASAGFQETAEMETGQIARIVGQFHLEASQIEAIVKQASADSMLPDRSSISPTAQCWHICRQQARSDLEGLAQRIPTQATWDDLILPEAQKSVLHTIAAQVRNRVRVVYEWRMRGSSLGVTALFSGSSGTGKTLAAEVIARELDLDLYRVDLAAVVSKYIGETEKNLRRLFATAESGGVVLLFDEADSLFGKRSEVKDSHDRHANIEVSYLLQRMESYRGLAILTTNLKSSLDVAFYRRLRFVVEFPLPDVALRETLWRQAFRPEITAELNMAHLAQLNFSGGSIRTCAINAAFLAAAENDCVRMRHVLAAAQAECAKTERRLTNAEISNWVLGN